MAFQEDVTPSGIHIKYYPEPHKYEVNGEPVPGVSSIVDILHAPPLIWWGQGQGIDGVVWLLGQGHLRSEAGKILHTDGRQATVRSIEFLLTQHKRTTNHNRDNAASRGSSVHDAFTLWTTTGLRVDVDSYPEEERCYLQGLYLFLDEHKLITEHSELMVASAKHKFAGRLDWRGKLDGSKAMLDLKTSRAIPRSKRMKHQLQLAGYEGACVESGYGKTGRQVNLYVSATGEYRLVECDRTYRDFLAMRRAYDATR